MAAKKIDFIRRLLYQRGVNKKCITLSWLVYILITGYCYQLKDFYCKVNR